MKTKRKRDRSKEITCFCDAKPWPHRAMSVEDCLWEHDERDRQRREYERDNPNADYYRGWRYRSDEE